MPRHTNVFLVINLGCEMLYVIDQRLKAQCITVEKSGQVLRDLTCVLLDPKLLDQLMLPSDDAAAAVAESHRPQLAAPQTPPRKPHLLSHTHCRRLLSDIACCSLMRLDPGSMDKLWDLTVMVLKWQLTLLTAGQQHTASASATQPLLDLTFRHMDGIARLLPDSRKTTLVDCTKRHLIEFWDQMAETERLNVLESMTLWLRPFAVKISLLMRLGFQRPDATFETAVDSEFFRYYADHVGENVYTKHAYMTTVGGGRRKGASRNRLRVQSTSGGEGGDDDEDSQQRSREIDALAAQLSVTAVAKRPQEAIGGKGNRAKMAASRAESEAGRRALKESSTTSSTSSSASTSTVPSVVGCTNPSDAVAAATTNEEFAGDNGILDEVSFDLDAYNRKRRADLRAAGETIITIDSRDSEFEHVQRTCSSLDAIIDRFSLDFFRPMGDVGIIEELDCTRELLRLLDEG